jgi:NAD(P)-dependent dehydrogenase (short-subunit alcohol dehydrogenase family)
MSALRYAIVTGAASGLGRAIAVRLARDGWQLSLADVDTASAAQTLELVRQAGGDGRVDGLDVADAQGWRTLVEQLRVTWPRLDLLVNNAGVAIGGEADSLSLEDWRATIDINLWGTIYGCHECLGWLKENSQNPKILNIASILGLIPGPMMGPYSVSKAAVIAFSETLAAELKSRVGVTIACPGFFRTQLLTRAKFTKQEVKDYANEITDRAKIDADAVADAVVRGVERGELYVVLPARARRLWLFKRWFPTWFMQSLVKTHAKLFGPR